MSGCRIRVATWSNITRRNFLTTLSSISTSKTCPFHGSITSNVSKVLPPGRSDQARALADEEDEEEEEEGEPSLPPSGG